MPGLAEDHRRIITRTAEASENSEKHLVNINVKLNILLLMALIIIILLLI